MFSDGSVCNSFASEMPLWLVSCHNRKELNMESWLSIMPSLFPPFCVLSYSAKAKNPFFDTPCGGGG